MNDKTLSRRQFIKVAGGLTAAAAVAGGVNVAYASSQDTTGKDVSRTTGRQLQAIPTTCQLCQARCGMIAFLQDERLVKVEGNPAHPNSRGRICAKGQAAPNLVYSPDRLLYPMRRVGRRGDGNWQRVSWREALEEIASKLKALRDAGHANQLVFQGGTMATPRFVSRFMSAFGTPTYFLSTPSTDTNRLLALNSTLGVNEVVADAAHAKYVLNFGSNPYEAHWHHVPLVQRLVQGRLDGSAKLVTFDVRLSKTAGKSDEWFPINPGTDGLVALSLACVVMEEHLYDEDFVSRWVNYPVSDLSMYLAKFKPESTQKDTGLDAADVRRIAREYATSRPATVISGTGVSMRENGVENERSLLLLSAITGNIDVPGGVCLPRTYNLREIDPVPQAPAPISDLTKTPISSHLVLSAIREGKLKAGVYMTYMFNPAYSNANNGASAEVLKDESLIPFFVAVDLFPSETAALADIVLPDTTFLERWDLESCPSFELVPHISLRQPVVKSPGEAAPFHDVLIELGRRVGADVEKYFSFRGAQDYVKIMAGSVPGLNQSGGLDYLKKHGVWFDDKAKPDYRSYNKSGFKTASGKVQVYVDKGKTHILSPLPEYRMVKEYTGAHDGDLFLVTFKWNVLTSSLAASKWLAEIVHGNSVLINAGTANSMGIKDGDTIQVASNVGTAKGKVRLTQGIHPRVVASPTGTGHWGLGKIAQAKRFDSDDPDTKIVWWGDASDGPHPNKIIPPLNDQEGHGQAWHDTVVKVTKTESTV